MASPNAPAPGSLRAKLVDNLVDALQAGATSDVASTIGAEIEAAINDRLTGREYAAKGRSLVFNLKKNEELRTDVLSGSILPSSLVTASPNDLATNQLKLARAQSLERKYAQRSLGQSDELAVGWAAGTSGKLDWSHKYEKEKPSVGAVGDAVGGTVTVDDDDDDDDEADGGDTLKVARGQDSGDLGAQGEEEEEREEEDADRDDDGDDGDDGEAASAFLSSGFSPKGGDAKCTLSADSRSRPAPTATASATKPIPAPKAPVSRSLSMSARPRPAGLSAADDIPIDFNDLLAGNRQVGAKRPREDPDSPFAQALVRRCTLKDLAAKPSFGADEAAAAERVEAAVQRVRAIVREVRTQVVA